MGKKGDLSDFERGVVVGVRRADLSISQTADLLGCSRTTISRVYREWSEKEKLSSERQLCEQMDYSNRRPHRVPLLSAKNRKRRIQFAQAHQNWTIEDWKNVVWSDESRFLLWLSDGRVRIWCKEHEIKDPSCLFSMVQAAGGGVMVWGIFSWHTLSPLVPIKHRLNATAYLSIVTEHVDPFMTTVYSSSDGYFQQDNAHVTKLKSSQTGFLNMTMSSLYSRGGELWHWRAGVPAESSSNPNQTHLNRLIKVFTVQLDIIFQGWS